MRSYRMKIDPITFHNAIGELLKYSLIRRLSDIRMLTIHRLVQQVIQDGMEESQTEKNGLKLLQTAFTKRWLLLTRRQCICTIATFLTHRYALNR